MNLVAKEYVASQDPADPGVLILSRFAGAAAEFEDALLVNPYDPEAVGTAICKALEMPLAERMDRHRKLFQTMLDNDIRHWGDRFLTALTGYEMSGAARPSKSRNAGDGQDRGTAISSSERRSAGMPRISSTAEALSMREPPIR